MVEQLFYVSAATDAMNDAEWERIERESSIYNALNGVTGLCCYDGHGFMQLIEGAQGKVEPLMDRIMRDHCHAEISIDYRGQAKFASYGEWNMRFVRMPEDPLKRRAMLEQLMAPSLLPELREKMLAWANKPA